MLNILFLFLLGNIPSNNTSSIQPQSLSTPVNTSALAVLSGLSADRLGIDNQNRRSRKYIFKLNKIIDYKLILILSSWWSERTW